MRVTWAMVLAACVTSNPQRVATNPDPILCDGNLECPAGMRCDRDDSFEMVCETPTLSAASRQRNAAPLRCVPDEIDAGTADRKAGLPPGTVLCGADGSCPPGMECAVIDEVFNSRLSGVPRCLRKIDRSAAQLRTGPWDAGVVRWLDEPFDAGVP